MGLPSLLTRSGAAKIMCYGCPMSLVTSKSTSARQALIYEDVGVWSTSVDAIHAQLKQLLDPGIVIRRVNADYLASQPWQDRTIVLIMGSGTCSLWD